MGERRLQAWKCKASKWSLALKHLMWKAETMHLNEAINLHSCSPPCVAGCCRDSQGSACLSFWFLPTAITSFLFPTRPVWSLALPPAMQGNRLSNHTAAWRQLQAVPSSPLTLYVTPSFKNFFLSLGIKSADVVSSTANSKLPLLPGYLSYYSES